MLLITYIELLLMQMIAKEFKINDDKIKYKLHHLIIPNRRLNTYKYKNYFVIDNYYNGNI